MAADWSSPTTFHTTPGSRHGTPGKRPWKRKRCQRRFLQGHELRVSSRWVLCSALNRRVSMLITPSRACSSLTPQFDFVEPTVAISLQLRAYALGAFCCGCRSLLNGQWWGDWTVDNALSLFWRLWFSWDWNESSCYHVSQKGVMTYFLVEITSPSLVGSWCTTALIPRKFVYFNYDCNFHVTDKMHYHIFGRRHVHHCIVSFSAISLW